MQEQKNNRYSICFVKNQDPQFDPQQHFSQIKFQQPFNYCPISQLFKSPSILTQESKNFIDQLQLQEKKQSSSKVLFSKTGFLEIRYKIEYLSKKQWFKDLDLLCIFVPSFRNDMGLSYNGGKKVQFPRIVALIQYRNDKQEVNFEMIDPDAFDNDSYYTHYDLSLYSAQFQDNSTALAKIQEMKEQSLQLESRKIKNRIKDNQVEGLKKIEKIEKNIMQDMIEMKKKKAQDMKKKAQDMKKMEELENELRQLKLEKLQKEIHEFKQKNLDEDK